MLPAYLCLVLYLVRSLLKLANLSDDMGYLREGRRGLEDSFLLVPPPPTPPPPNPCHTSTDMSAVSLLIHLLGDPTKAARVSLNQPPASEADTW